MRLSQDTDMLRIKYFQLCLSKSGRLNFSCELVLSSLERYID